jgi:hypothetical protein
VGVWVRRLLVYGVALSAAPVMVALLAVPDASIGASDSLESPPCDVPGTHTLLQNQWVRVYLQRVPKPGRGSAAFACDVFDPGPYSLDGDGTLAFRPPAMSLRGPVLGYAYTDCNDVATAEAKDCATWVHVINFQTDGREVIRAHSAGPGWRAFTRVGSLRANDSGSVAWITCPPRGEPVDAMGQRQPNCVRPGDRDSLWLLDIRARHPKLLDRGRGLDPSSLHLVGSSILTWRNGGKRKLAMLR